MQHYLKYALEKDTNRIVGVDDVANGLACGCFCPDCKQRLIARNGGDMRVHHFAHYNGIECAGARMTTLHLLAQQIIAENKSVMLPDYQGDFYFHKTGRITFDEILLEAKCENLRPDCIGIVSKDGGNHRLWIEIYVKHKVDEQKRKSIKAQNEACIEIDISDLLKMDYTKDDLARRLKEEKNDRKWINCPKYEKINNAKRAIVEEELRRRYETERIEEEREEIERRRREEAERINQERLEKEELEVRKVWEGKVKRWYESGDTNMAKCFINEIEESPFRKEARFKGYYTKNILYDVLIPNNDILLYVECSPKTNSALHLFYTLLHYYYNQTTCIDYLRLKQKLKQYQYKRTALTSKEKIYLEQLVSLQIIHNLEKRRESCFAFDGDYKEIIKIYSVNPKVRNEVLMVTSVLYHHIIGSNAVFFGELTQQIIQEHPHLANSYLSVIKSQDKHPNNYYIDSHNTLDDLENVVKYNSYESSNMVDIILRECFSFAFQSIQFDYTEKEEEAPKIDMWKELNDMYKNA